MPSQDADRRGPASSRMRVSTALLLGLVAAVIVLLTWQPVMSALIGWDVAAGTYLIWAFLTGRRLDAEATAAYSVREDPGRRVTDLILLAASVASLGAVGAVIASAGPGTGVNREFAIAVAVGSLVLSWALVHVLYAGRYARLYYTSPVGGVDFNDDEPPAYADFAYLAFTIGMTYQVSDTSLRGRAMRATALRHSLLSYLLGAVIIASTINLLAGLAN